MAKVIAKKNNNKAMKVPKVVVKKYSPVISQSIKNILDEQRTKKLHENVIGEIAKYFQESKAKSDKPDKPRKIDFKSLAKFANPAMDTVSKDIGLYNPDTIDVTVYELMRKDPQLSAGLAMVKLPIIALPWRIECDDEDIARFCENTLSRVWKSLIKTMLTAVDFGFAAHEKVWKRENITVQSIKKSGDENKSKKKTHYNGDAVFYKEFKPLYPSSVILNFDRDVFKGIEQTSVSGISDGKPPEIDARKSFIFTNDKEFGNMFGRSRLKSAYKLWYWKELMYQFMLQYYERRGSPPVIVIAPPGQSQDSSGTIKDNLELALDLGSSLINHSVGALPYEESASGRENMWQIDYMLDDRRGTMFIEAINHLDAKCFLALWVPERLGENKTSGSFAETNVIVDLFLLSEKALIAEVEDHVNKYILPQLIDFNFPKSKRVPAYLKMDQLDWNRRLAVKEIFIEMLRNVDTMIQSGIVPRSLPALEKMAGILEIPIEPFEEAIRIPESIGAKVRDLPPGSGQGGKVIPLPKRTAPRRRSDSGRVENRRTIRPGTKPAEQQRARAQMDYETIVLDEEFIEESFDYGLGPAAKSRKWLIKQAHSVGGLSQIKKALFRLVMWSNREFITNYNTMNSIGIARSVEVLPDHVVDIIIEAMGQTIGGR